MKLNIKASIEFFCGLCDFSLYSYDCCYYASRYVTEINRVNGDNCRSLAIRFPDPPASFAPLFLRARVLLHPLEDRFDPHFSFERRTRGRCQVVRIVPHTFFTEKWTIYLLWFILLFFFIFIKIPKKQDDTGDLWN